MKVTFARYHSFKDKEGVTHTMATQLYQVGVYAIVDSNPAMQLSLTPKQVVNIQNKLRRDEKSGIITDLIFGGEMTVTDQNGYWEDETIVRLKELERLEGVFIEVGKEYVTNRKAKCGEKYKLTVVEIENDNNNPSTSQVKFSLSPLSDVLKSMEVGKNLYQCTVGLFQRTIVVI